MRPHSEEKKRLPNPNSHPARLPHDYCKRGKGEHDYGFLNAQVYNHHCLDRRFLHEYDRVSVMIEHQCRACGKIKRRLKWIKGEFDIQAYLDTLPVTDSMQLQK